MPLRARFQFVARAAVLCGAAALPWPLIAAEAPAPLAAKPYALYMGTDLSVEREKKLYRVEDVSGSEFKIRVGQHEVFVPTRNRKLVLQVSNSLKLSGTAVKLDKLKTGPTYTAEKDPVQKLVRASQQATGAAADQDLAIRDMRNAEGALGLATADGDLALIAATQANFDRSQSDLSHATDATMSDMTNIGAAIAGAGGYDAMEASFKVSSEVPLNDPYMIVLFKFRDADARPNTSSLLVHAEALAPIGEKPRYVRIVEGGMSPGFEILECEVHIYNRGEEVPTNLSAKRVDLSREEAQLYLVMEHVGAHKGATVPATAVRGTLPVAQRQRLTHAQLTRAVYAKVSKDGAMLGVFDDADCRQPLEDATLATAMNDLFLRPALEDGKPADGVARLRLADL